MITHLLRITILTLLLARETKGFIFTGFSGGGQQRQRQRQGFAQETQSRDFYKILGIRRNANSKAIKKAYRSLALEWHPDKHSGTDLEEKANEKIVDINAAYEVLSDDELKAKYDRCGEACLSENAQAPPQQQQGEHFFFHQGRPTNVATFEFKQHKDIREIGSLNELIAIVTGGDSGDQFIREGWQSVVWAYWNNGEKKDIERAAARFNSRAGPIVTFTAVNCSNSRGTFCVEHFNMRVRQNQALIAKKLDGVVKFESYSGAFAKGAFEKYLIGQITKEVRDVVDKASLEMFLSENTGKKPKLLFAVKNKSQQILLARRFWNYPHAAYAITYMTTLRDAISPYVPAMPVTSASAGVRVLHFYETDHTDLTEYQQGKGCEWVEGFQDIDFDSFTKNVRSLATDKLNKTGKYDKSQKALVLLTHEEQSKGYCGKSDSSTCFILLRDPSLIDTKNDIFRIFDSLRKTYSNDDKIKFAILPQDPSVTSVFTKGVAGPEILVALKPKMKRFKIIPAKINSIGQFVSNVVDDEGLRLGADGVIKLDQHFVLPRPARNMHDEL